MESLITKSGQTLFELYKFLKNYKKWPIENGLIKQSSKFLHCLKWCDLVNLKQAELAQKEKEEKAGFAQNFSKMMSSKKR